MICYEGTVTVKTLNKKQVYHNHGTDLLFNILCQNLCKKDVGYEQYPTYIYTVNQSVYDKIKEENTININLFDNNYVNEVQSTRIYINGMLNDDNCSVTYKGVLTNNHLQKSSEYSGDGDIYLVLTDASNKLLACCPTKLKFEVLETAFQSTIEWTIRFFNKEESEQNK